MLTWAIARMFAKDPLELGNEVFAELDEMRIGSERHSYEVLER